MGVVLTSLVEVSILWYKTISFTFFNFSLFSFEECGKTWNVCCRRLVYVPSIRNDIIHLLLRWPTNDNENNWSSICFILFKMARCTTYCSQSHEIGYILWTTRSLFQRLWTHHLFDGNVSWGNFWIEVLHSWMFSIYVNSSFAVDQESYSDLYNIKKVRFDQMNENVDKGNPNG